MSDKILAITDDTFEKEVLQNDIPVLIDFWAPWCGPCKAIGPIMEELAASFSDKMKFTKCNVDENPQLPAKFAVQAIPTVMFFDKGAEVDKFVGMIPKTEIEKKIKAII